MESRRHRVEELWLLDGIHGMQSLNQCDAKTGLLGMRATPKRGQISRHSL